MGTWRAATLRWMGEGRNLRDTGGGTTPVGSESPSQVRVPVSVSVSVALLKGSGPPSA